MKRLYDPDTLKVYTSNNGQHYLVVHGKGKKVKFGLLKTNGENVWVPPYAKFPKCPEEALEMVLADIHKYNWRGERYDVGYIERNFVETPILTDEDIWE